MSYSRRPLQRSPWPSGLIVLAVAVAAWFFWPRPADMRRFNPARMGQLEARMWRSYYEQRRVALAADVYRMSRQEYGFSPWASVRLAWSAGRAAKLFQPTRSRTEAERVIPILETYFRIIRDESGERFDPATAAREELEWWQLRREGKTWEEYAPAVSRVSATLYGTRSELVLNAARLRSEMMARRDGLKERGPTEAEWQEIERGLVSAWQALKQVVARKE